MVNLPDKKTKSFEIMQKKKRIIMEINFVVVVVVVVVVLLLLLRFSCFCFKFVFS